MHPGNPPWRPTLEISTLGNLPGNPPWKPTLENHPGKPPWKSAMEIHHWIIPLQVSLNSLFLWNPPIWTEPHLWKAPQTRKSLSAAASPKPFWEMLKHKAKSHQNKQQHKCFPGQNWTPCSHNSGTKCIFSLLEEHPGRSPQSLSLPQTFNFHSKIKGSRRPLHPGLLVLPSANSFIPGMSWSVFYPFMLMGCFPSF